VGSNKGLSSVGGRLSRFGLPAEYAEGSEGAAQQIGNNHAGQNPYSSGYGPQNGVSNVQGNPPSGLYGSKSVTPEIVDPSAMSRSRMGIGTDDSARDNPALSEVNVTR
jgi:hypothetical protein